ncbi:MAG: hypothetical protein IK121_11475 [Lachnospiraceae bacterium]|nr:hypothetical protein [Lachnospiraceae bacterium]
MDKYEYKVRADEIRALIQAKKYREAVEIADTIEWRNVRNSMMLCTISDLYKMCKRFEDSRDVLMLAYQRNPGGRMILYSLCELSIKLGDVVNAIEYYKEFVAVAPRDTGRFVLKYKLYTAQEVGLEERIGVLEELQQYECKEKWMYELAYLYHMMGYGDRCVEECDQIVIYFGEGKYVIKALELKALHQPLSAEQDVIYRRLTDPKANEVLVKDMDVSKFNTIDLQKELANSLAEVLYDDTQPIPEIPEGALKEEPKQEEQVVYEEPVLEEEPKEEVNEPEEKEEEPYKEPDLNEAYEEYLKNPVDNTQDLDIPTVQEEIKKEEPFVIKDNTPSDETKIFSIKDVEAGLRKEPSISRTVMPQKNLDEMHEVMPRSSKNPAIIFPNYDDMVSMEGDGQISFNLPEQEMVDKQITGQISIEEVLAEWERMKNASEKKWREDMRRKVIQQTNGMFKSFDETSKDGLLEKLEDEVKNSDRVELTREEENNLTDEGLSIEAFSNNLGEASLAAEASLLIKEPEAEETEEKNENDIREILVDEEPTPEELTFDRTPYINEDEEKIEVSEPEEIVSEDTTDNTQDKEIDYLMAFAEASEERDMQDLAAMSAQEEVFFEEEPTEDVDETVDEQTEAFEEEAEELNAEVPEEVVIVNGPTEEEFEEACEEETEEALEEEKQEEVPAEETVEDADNFVEDVDENVESTESMDENVEDEPLESTYEEAEEVYGESEEYKDEVRASGFTAEQEERFEAYIQNEVGREQLKQVLAGASLEGGHGNVIIGSDDVDSGVDLAKAIIMELASKDTIGGKVAKIKASTLNAKDAEETLSKLDDGALIIQDANELRKETLESIRKVVSDKNKRLFIILTMIKRTKHKFVMENAGFLEAFDVSMDIESLTNKELVAYAKGYAYSKEYAIDEMGMLALHTRIDERQTNQHAVTVTEVREMVDEAIEKATKKNVKHFVDVLVGKRYDDNDMLVLKEKDFSE